MNDAPTLNDARAFWMVAPGRGEIRAETLWPQPGQVRVRTLATGISRGTESLVFAGRVPASQYAVMRAPLMGGDFPFPVKYGYSAVGLTPDLARVFVLHPHQDVFDAPQAMCIPVPGTVPTERAVLAANMETALNILWDSAPLAGERILVIGAGVVGLLTAALCARIPATRVTVVDIDPAREALARQLGCDFAAPESAPDEQELIVHASASEAGLRLALAKAAFENDKRRIHQCEHRKEQQHRRLSHRFHITGGNQRGDDAEQTNDGDVRRVPARMDATEHRRQQPLRSHAVKQP